MFYCNDCAKKEGWPTDTLVRSFGNCERCKAERHCNDVPSSQLPEPEMPALEEIQRKGGEEIQKDVEERLAAIRKVLVNPRHAICRVITPLKDKGTVVRFGGSSAWVVFDDGRVDLRELAALTVIPWEES